MLIKIIYFIYRLQSQLIFHQYFKHEYPKINCNKKPDPAPANEKISKVQCTSYGSFSQQDRTITRNSSSEAITQPRRALNSPGVIEHSIDPLLVDGVLTDARHRFAHLQPDASTAPRVGNVAQATIGLDQKPKARCRRNASIDRLQRLLGDDRGRCCLDG